MPPMSSVRTFINALRTGETRTTRALNKVVSQRRGAGAVELMRSLRKRGAISAPLQPPLRDALRRAALPDEMITECIDRWPEEQKERVRRIVVRAVRDGRRVRFAWGLTAARRPGTEVSDSGRGVVTITALSPRSTLRVYGDGEVNVAPVRPPRARK